MKKPAARIRDEIARLQEQLKAAETREAERIGRLALKAGLGELAIEDAELQTALEELVRNFQGSGKQRSSDAKGHAANIGNQLHEAVASGTPARPAGEA